MNSGKSKKTSKKVTKKVMAKSAHVDALKNLRSIANVQSGENYESIKELIPTGHSELDMYISRGIHQDEYGNTLKDAELYYGIPSDTVVELYGSHGSGKSSLAYRICGYAQRMGKIPFWVDGEGSFSPHLARINGCETASDQFILQRSYNAENADETYSAEDIFDKMIAAAKGGAGIIVLDSIASLVTKYELEHPADQETMAIKSRVISRLLPRLTAAAKANNVLIILVNQLRTDLGKMYGNKDTTPGGKSIGFFASLRLKVTKKTSKDSEIYIQNDGESAKMIGGTAMVRIEKNRYSSPHNDNVLIPIYYQYYFPSAEETIFEYGRRTKVIKVRNSIFSWNNVKIEGKTDFMNELFNKNLLQDLVEDITENSGDIPLPPEIINYEKHTKFKSNNQIKTGDVIEYEKDKKENLTYKDEGNSLDDL